MMFIFRAVFWLFVVTVFMPPEQRVIDLGDFRLPRSLSVAAYDPHSPTAFESASDEEAYCARNAATCAGVLSLLDSAVDAGVSGLEALQSELASDDKAR